VSGCQDDLKVPFFAVFGGKEVEKGRVLKALLTTRGISAMLAALCHPANQQLFNHLGDASRRYWHLHVLQGRVLSKVSTFLLYRY
jgi:hypothetical protein